MNLFLNLLTSDSSQQQQTNFWQSAGIWILLAVLLIGLFVFNYFTRKKQQKAAEEKMSALKAGDKIKTIGLICGTIVSVDDVQNTVVIETGDDDHHSFLTIDKSAIYQVFPAGSGVNGVTQVTDEPAGEDVKTESENVEATETVEEIDEVAEDDKNEENK